MKELFMLKLMGIYLPRHDFWDSLISAGTGLLENLKKVTPIAGGIGLAVLGFMFMYSDKTRGAAKSALPYILGGILLIFLALQLSNWVKGIAAF